MPDDDAVTFHRYVKWLYSGKVCCKGAESGKKYDMLARLYGLGERLLDTPFQDRIIDAIVCVTREVSSTGKRRYPTKTTVDTVYASTPEGSPARKLMVDIHVLYGQVKWLGSRKQPNNPDFLLDLACALLKKRVILESAKEDYGELEVGVPVSYYKGDKDEVSMNEEGKGGCRW